MKCKIKILNDGGFDSLAGVNFPVIVNGTLCNNCGFDVDPMGFRQFGLIFDDDYGPFYFSILTGECEVLE
nr:MAG TPA: hypothetical protein [Caudoviricetes sp.]